MKFKQNYHVVGTLCKHFYKIPKIDNMQNICKEDGQVLNL